MSLCSKLSFAKQSGLRPLTQIQRLSPRLRPKLQSTPPSPRAMPETWRPSVREQLDVPGSHQGLRTGRLQERVSSPFSNGAIVRSRTGPNANAWTAGTRDRGHVIQPPAGLEITASHCRIQCRRCSKLITAVMRRYLLFLTTSREIAGSGNLDRRTAKPMTDIVDKATRSRMMAGISAKDTKPERILRRALHTLGFRFRLHVRGLPGTPDLVLHRYRAVCFVHGCFWHRHDGCSYATAAATRPEFWQAKFDGNVERDRRPKHQLFEAGWRVATAWECALGKDTRAVTVRALEQWLRGSAREYETAPHKPRVANPNRKP